MKFEDITEDDIQILANGLSWMEGEGWWDTLDEEVNRGYAVLSAIALKIAEQRNKNA